MISDRKADLVFRALGDATRRDIVRRSIQGNHSVSALARRYPISVTAVQKHVAVLERAGLVTKTKHGREQLVQSSHETLVLAKQLLEQMEIVWRDRIDAIEALVMDDNEGNR
jgi:DNA-binding transcriptional ArsR family regulator